MPRIRSVHPDICDDETLAEVTAYQKRAIPQASKRAVAERYGLPRDGVPHAYPCAYCGHLGTAEWDIRPGQRHGYVLLVGLEWDHVDPERAGGSGDASNLVWACRPCNRAKGATVAWKGRV
jgi:5-methylcytosine-specific restriction endonuclease McrA